MERPAKDNIAKLFTFPATLLALPVALATPLLAASPQEGEVEGGAEDGPQAYEPDPEFVAFVESLDFETGTVEMASGAASLDLPEGWAYLQGRDARRVVEDHWGNPEDPDVLGFIDPPSEYGRLEASWGIIVSYEEDGYISDEDAEDIDYGDLLKSMQSDMKAANEYRAENGYGTVELIGWAEPPHYEHDEKKLYWAKELSFDGSEEHAVNYDVRILGRYGALVLQSVAPMSALDKVHSGSTTILQRVSFNEGHRYSDFDSSVDKVAAYGIGGLIAGKVLAKAGFFAVIAKFSKFIVVGIIALFAGVRRFFTGPKAETVDDPVAEA